MKLLQRLSLLVLSSRALAQFVEPPKDLINATGYAGVQVRYKEVPCGICELNPDVKSYAGYVDVAQDQHLFFWFFEARTVKPEDAPLTVWINGGPGSSSMIGLFQENGPCTVNSEGEPVNNPYSWNEVSNMIFIDQPTQVGFSYSIPIPGYLDPNSGLIVQLPSNECPEYAADWSCGTYSYPNETLTASSTPQGADNFWRAIQGFMGAFPQYSKNSFYFTTESYGGHYAPIYSEYFEAQNAKQIYGAHQISLEGVLIGNGWFDPILQYASYYNFSVSPGNTYDFDPYNQSTKDLWYNNMYGNGNCLDQIKDCNARGIDEICMAADNFCAQQVENIFDIYTGRDEYDIRELVPDPFPPTFYVDYLNTEKVQQAIGAYQNFSEGNDAVYAAFTSTGDDGRRLDTVESVLKLIEQNVTVILYHGDADYNCNWIGGEAVAEEVGAPNYGSAGYINITTSDNVVHGQVKQAGKFAFVRIYESGHEVPFYQPVVSLEMFDRVLNGLDVATGKEVVTDNYITVGTPKSTYREGNGTIQTEVISTNATYNTTTNMPNLPLNTTNAKRSINVRSKGRRRFTLPFQKTL